MSQRYRLSPQPGLRDRSTLLGVPDSRITPPSSGRSSPFDGSLGGQRYADDLEGQNDEQVENLTAKVKMLKDITIGIGNEVRDSTIQLSHMNDAFAETGDILSGTFRRMNNMAERHGCRWLWYIVFLVFVFWFFIVVWWFRR
ncbi:hypothetical protein OE88DRAFT_1803998 [Heliocybe sulcata]|uniref:t-SNARE coiled-coil homology domain-containing protein n=1 Tax=Heliocybe sulcata TaxID=5364 RepID=A0A5C3NLV0_9AGAM|nr:hypothetical protein OE88DRAFT_1803998 [Heliocybe sulcata]